MRKKSGPSTVNNTMFVKAYSGTTKDVKEAKRDK